MIGTLVMTPQEIFEAYTAGTMPRDEMIERVASYPFAVQPETDGYDWMTATPDGPTWMEVSYAKRRGMITREDYAAILELRNKNR